MSTNPDCHYTRIDKPETGVFSSRLLTIAFLFLPLLFASCTPKLGDSDAALLLEDILAGEDNSRLKATTPQPTRQTVEYNIDNRHRSGDLYLSPEGAQAGIVLIPGMVKKGKDDLRLVTLANSLARLRFAVLVPEIKSLRQLYTRTSDVRIMADAFRYLDEQVELPPTSRKGFGGFSYGVGIVLLASLEQDIQDKVDYIMGFGGYYDIANIVSFFTTGYYRDDKTGELVYRRPHYYLKQVFTISNSALLKSPADRDRVRELIEDDDEDLYLELEKLAPDARALYNLITNQDPKRVKELIDDLSPPVKNELQGINPSKRDLSQIKAQVILLHGRGDTMIPYTESISIAKSLPPDNTTLFLIDGYAHTNVKPKPQDLPQLLSAMDLLMRQRNTTQTEE